ncbi:MAG: FmdE family protein [Candidatus Bathyarchaeales archaeon]
MLDENEALTLEIKNAENLHGHLGPFLVIGVKIARLAKKSLNLDYAKHKELQITAALPLSTPFSCIIDGIQAATQCTVGNQKLKIKNSKETITATFKLKNQSKTLKIQVNPQVLEMLKDWFSKGVSNEELAWKIALMPENQLLKIENG